MDTLIVDSFIVVLLLSTIAYLISLLLKKTSVIDGFWGLFFLAILVTCLLKEHGPFGTTQIVVSLYVFLWAVRIILHVGTRAWARAEDFRYQALREKWGNWYGLRSYFQVFVVQAVFATIISLPLIAVIHANNLGHHSYETLQWWQFIAIGLWSVGFFFESLGDYELRQFQKTRKPNQILNTGLWEYSRHPNYFGEITQWFAIWLFAVALPYGLLTVVGPALLAVTIIYFSGIPPIENKYKSNPGYKSYMERTSMLIPMPPKAKKS